MKIQFIILCALTALSSLACSQKGTIEELNDELASGSNPIGANIINIGALPGAGSGEFVTTSTGYKISAAVNGDITENVVTGTGYKIEGVVLE